jgi:hypothetical protein
MALQHPRADLVQGDTWKIYGTMEDDRGQVQDVTGLINAIRWVLVTEARTNAINGSGSTVTAVDADQGTILITVEKEVTEDVPPGRYTDYCWIDMPDGRRTKWFGEIYVHAGPPGGP